MTHETHCLTYAAVATSYAIALAAHLLGIHLDMLSITKEIVVVLAYIKLSRP